jgi:hypothetical protein
MATRRDGSTGVKEGEGAWEKQREERGGRKGDGEMERW